MAIAVDASSTGALVNPGTSSTIAHTCTGSNLILYVALFGDNQSTDATGSKIAGVTYAGVNMVEVPNSRTFVTGDRWIYLFYLLNPATGNNNIIISSDGSSIAIQGFGQSYTGVKQSGVPDAQTTNQVTSQPANTDWPTSLASATDNCWHLLVAKAVGGVFVAGTGTTQRTNQNNTGIFDSNAPQTPVGSVTLNVKANAIRNMASIMISFAPLVASLGTTISSYSESNENSNGSLDNGNFGYAQSFTASTQAVLTSASFYLKKTASPTGNAVAKLYATSGAFGSASIPTGAALATSANFDVSTLTTAYQLINFTFSGANQVTIESQSNYCISVEYGTGDAVNIVFAAYANPGTAIGNLSRLTGGGWGAFAALDLTFYVFGTAFWVATLV